jgi:hypothetical protein
VGEFEGHMWLLKEFFEGRKICSDIQGRLVPHRPDLTAKSRGTLLGVTAYWV